MAFIPAYILILLFLIMVDYAMGILIEKSSGGKRKAWLVVSLVSNLSILGLFKYYNFLNQTVLEITRFFNFQYPLPFLDWVLPVGLSFHTFQAMSYTIEVFRGTQKAERHPGIFALYVLFYPQLVAGPIERPGHLIPQFYENHSFDFDRLIEGLKRMVWGFFKKVVIADRFAIFVNAVFAAPEKQDGFSLLLAAYFFAFQIYCDFSGYSDIAIGAVRVLGFRLINNFDNPYFSKSISEFWRRWHISLSSWFRDYVYIPLGGNRLGKGRHIRNLVIVFLLSGLWHGANWTFIAWGFLHACCVSLEVLLAACGRFFENFPKKFKKVVRIAGTFHLIVLGWVFFRAESIQSAWYYLLRLTGAFSHDFWVRAKVWADRGFQGLPPEFYFSAGLIFFLLWAESKGRFFLKSCHPALSTALSVFGYGLLVIMILTAGVFDEVRFIYFQF